MATKYLDNEGLPFVLSKIDQLYERKTSLADVARSGDYNDLENTPTIPTTPEDIGAMPADTTLEDLGGVATTKVGSANGVAPLNADGIIDSTYLPSYVNDVIEAYIIAGSTPLSANWLTLVNNGTAPLVPEAGKIYIVLSSGDYHNRQYRWAETTYEVLSAPVDLSGYAESADLATVATTGSYNDLTDKPIYQIVIDRNEENLNQYSAIFEDLFDDLTISKNYNFIIISSGKCYQVIDVDKIELIENKLEFHFLATNKYRTCYVKKDSNNDWVVDSINNGTEFFSSTDAALNYQKKLTAGTGIDITNNVISATGSSGINNVITIDMTSTNFNEYSDALDAIQEDFSAVKDYIFQVKGQYGNDNLYPSKQCYPFNNGLTIYYEDNNYQLCKVQLKKTGTNWVIDYDRTQNNIKTYAMTSDLSSKQNVLTAGTGITISNNVISATGGLDEDDVLDLINQQLGVIENGTY